MKWRYLSDEACLFFRKQSYQSDSRELTVRTLKREAVGCFETTVTTKQATDTINQTTADLISTARKLVYNEQKVYNVQFCKHLHLLRPPPPLQINVTGEVHLKLTLKVVGSRNVYCGFQCQPYKSHISTRNRYTNFSLCHFNADNIKKIRQINPLNFSGNYIYHLQQS
jgi:hypothetical protein